VATAVSVTAVILFVGDVDSRSIASDNNP
jgi:hypothetical protein